MSLEPVIGIDLGTTYSAVATVRQGQPIIIPSRSGSRLTPSIVGFALDNARIAGEAARLLSDDAPDRVAPAAKRFLGRRYTPDLAAAAKHLVPYPLLQGPQGEVRIKVAGRTLPLTQVSAMLLGELKLDAEAHFGRPVAKCVVTVPANFDDGQRNATREAARIAGLEVLRIVNEPTAAAVAYGLASKFTGRALVFDLGGGTFDVSVLEVAQGVYEVKATGGDQTLGGEDFDNRIAQWLLAQVSDGAREQVSRDRLSMQRLKHAAERAKRALSEKAEVLLSVADLGDHAEGPDGSKLVQIDTALTRDFFEQLAMPLAKRCLEVCTQVLDDAKLKARDIDAVLLVGGMTRVPMLGRMVTEYFGKAPMGGFNPDEVVALGAAVHANELDRQEGQSLLIDVATHTLSVGVAGGGVRRLIARNTPVPAVAKEVFLPGRTGQTEVRLPVYQGEADLAADCSHLGELVLSDLQVGHRTDVPIEVTFELTAEGTLSVRAVDRTTGMAEAIRVDARTTLAAAEVERLQREQQSWASEQGQKDKQAALQSFPRILDKAERLAVLLEKTAQENPGPDAEAVVGQVRALIARGRAGLKSEDAALMADVTRALEALLAAV